MSRISSATAVNSLTGDGTGAPEQSYLEVTADVGTFEVFTITIPATASSTQADYFTLENSSGVDFAAWTDIDAAGTAPTGAIYVAATNKITCGIATGDSAAQAAAKFKTAIEADGAFADLTIVDNSDGTLTFTSDKLGLVVDPAPHDDDDSAAGDIGVSVGTQGVASTLQNKFITFRTGADAAFNCWFNFNSEGSDPSAAGTAIPATADGEISAAALAIRIAIAINANANFEAEADGTRVKVTNAVTGVSTDMTAGDSGFTVATSTQGYAASYFPSLSPGSISNDA